MYRIGEGIERMRTSDSSSIWIMHRHDVRRTQCGRQLHLLFLLYENYRHIITNKVDRGTTTSQDIFILPVQILGVMSLTLLTPTPMIRERNNSTCRLQTDLDLCGDIKCINSIWQVV